jgi:hypothetical protein
MLAACNTTPKADIAALEVGLASAETLADIYVTQPACPAPSGVVVCADHDVLVKIRDARNVAMAAVTGAKAVVNSINPAASTVSNVLAGAQSAILSFQAIVNALPTTPKGG